MNFNLDSVTGLYRLGFPYGYLRTEKTSSRKSGTTVVVSFTSEGREKLLQAKSLDELEGRVTELSELIDSFEFPEGNNPTLYRTAIASNTTKVSVDAESGAEIKIHELDIVSIAKSKTFKSTVLSSNEETDLSSGTHTFEIEKNGTAQSVDIYVDKSAEDPDTNRDVFNKLVLAINEADSDLEAEVVETERKVYSNLSYNLYEEASYLKVSTKETGVSNDFILQDDSGTIVSDLKLDQNIQAGSTAVYVLNDISVESESNSIATDNGKLGLELLEETKDTVTIAVKNGSSSAQNQIKEIILTHNEYVLFLNKNGKYIDSSIKNSIVRDLNDIKDELEQSSFTLNSNGTVNITDRFEKEFEDNTDKVREILVGTEGLFPIITEDLNKISAADTSDYAADRNFNLGNVTFSFYF